jgi:hypothetical protein
MTFPGNSVAGVMAVHASAGGSGNGLARAAAPEGVCPSKLTAPDKSTTVRARHHTPVRVFIARRVIPPLAGERKTRVEGRVIRVPKEKTGAPTLGTPNPTVPPGVPVRVAQQLSGIIKRQKTNPTKSAELRTGLLEKGKGARLVAPTHRQLSSRVDTACVGSGPTRHFHSFNAFFGFSII